MSLPSAWARRSLRRRGSAGGSETGSEASGTGLAATSTGWLLGRAPENLLPELFVIAISSWKYSNSTYDRNTTLITTMKVNFLVRICVVWLLLLLVLVLYSQYGIPCFWDYKNKTNDSNRTEKIQRHNNNNNRSNNSDNATSSIWYMVPSIWAASSLVDNRACQGWTSASVQGLDVAKVSVSYGANHRASWTSNHLLISKGSGSPVEIEISAPY